MIDEEKFGDFYVCGYFVKKVVIYVCMYVFSICIIVFIIEGFMFLMICHTLKTQIAIKAVFFGHFYL